MDDAAVVARCAVLGSPVGHSLSPVLHTAAYAELGLTGWSYEAREVDEGALAGFLDGLDRSWRGLSLTMPLKRRVVPLLDVLSARARTARAANTVVLEADGTRSGHNTDIPGAAAALRERAGDTTLRSAIVVGGGATAASVLLALADLGCEEATVLARDPGRAAETEDALARHPRPPRLQVLPLDAPVARPVDLLVSTVPATAQDAATVALAETARVVFDVGYQPWPTPLAAAVGPGQVLVSGLDLLVHQAVLQVELMTGLRPGVATLRAAGEAALGGRAETTGGDEGDPRAGG